MCVYIGFHISASPHFGNIFQQIYNPCNIAADMSIHSTMFNLQLHCVSYMSNDILQTLISIKIVTFLINWQLTLRVTVHGFLSKHLKLKWQNLLKNDLLHLLIYSKPKEQSDLLKFIQLDKDKDRTKTSRLSSKFFHHLSGLNNSISCQERR